MGVTGLRAQGSAGQSELLGSGKLEQWQLCLSGSNWFGVWVVYSGCGLLVLCAALSVSGQQAGR